MIERMPSRGESIQRAPNQRVIDLLNEARNQELFAIAQYMAQHYELDDQGVGKLASEVKKIAIVEMRHAEKLAERVLFLNGQTVTDPKGAVARNQEYQDMMRTDIGLEVGAIRLYNQAAAICASENDQVSKDLFEELLNDEEGHVNFFETTLDHIEQLGAAYIATLMD